jgi:hypothetical protein
VSKQTIILIWEVTTFKRILKEMVSSGKEVGKEEIY